MSELEVEPGHELPADYTTQFRSIPAQRFEQEPYAVDADPLDVVAAFDAPMASLARREWAPLAWWVNYRASLMTRAALADTLTELGRIRLTVELWLVTAAFALFWTAFVLVGLSVAGLLLGLL